MEQAVRGLVLVPTKELARQAQSMIQQLAAYCARDVRVANVSAAEDSASQRWVRAAGLERSNAVHRCGIVSDKAGQVCQGEVLAAKFLPPKPWYLQSCVDGEARCGGGDPIPSIKPLAAEKLEAPGLPGATGGR